MKSKLSSPKINIITLGCSKNIFDSEVLIGLLKARGIDVKHEPKTNETDIVLINTCGFINDAKQESIDTILQYIDAKKQGLIKKVYVMGCLSQRYKYELRKEMPEVDAYFGVNEIKEIFNELNIGFNDKLTAERSLITPKHYAYLKIAEGCDRKCSFCAIPLIKGKHISRPVEQIVNEAKCLVDNMVKEIILISQDLTYYGVDIYKKKKLANLIEKLADIQDLKWLRLHYTYPAGFPLDVLKIIKERPNICNYIDIPLQHISDNILKSMRRNISAKDTIKLIETIRNKLPGVAIRTTLIVGYPGETEKNHEELKQFIKDSEFERLGVFKYSHEEDTAAFLLKDSIPLKVKQERADEIMSIQQQISLKHNQDKIGKVLKVLFDRTQGEYYVGRTEYDSPEVDNQVLVPLQNNKLQIGEFYNIKILEAGIYDLFGTIIYP
ncbi:MAG: 30S ribosomal protein S12 methylthiotransferase RimO [Bacteroidales bacterium]|nr:30S ribosomal protein S12 methylthiotransferase RimO [Bacteroidales bacterium]